MSVTAASAQQGAQQAGETFDAGHLIMHHIVDSREIVIPLYGPITLPRWEMAGYDVSITRSVVMMWLAGAILLVFFGLASRRAKEPVPRGLRNFLEVLVLYIRDEVARKTIPHHADRFVPYLLTCFFFILTCNLIGLVPGMSTATGCISVTATLAAFTFLLAQASGVREYGFVGHFRNLVPRGLPIAILPIMIPVEILSLFTKPFALAVRLFANMTAGHAVILSLVSIIFIMKSALWAGMSVPFALFVYGLEILVSFLQAFIFTMLSSLFIGMAVHSAH